MSGSLAAHLVLLGATSALGASEAADCNGNGIDDAAEIASGAAADCQPDGVPDECQLPFVTAVDDGGAEGGVISDGAYTAWLNRLTVVGGFGTVTAIDVKFGSAIVGSPVRIGVWSDPNGDGNPSDALLLSSREMTVAPGMDSPALMNRIDVPDVDVGAAGTNYFIGVIVDAPGIGGAAIDLTAPHVSNASWIIGATQPIDADDLAANSVEFAPIETSFAGNWVLRAVDASGGTDCNENGVPDTCDLVAPPFASGAAYWRFESESASSALDSGPNALHGTYSGGALLLADVATSTVAQSGAGNSRSLDLNYTSPTAGGVVTVPDASPIDLGATSFTIEAWVRLEQLSGTTSASRQWLCQKKPTASADASLDYGVLVQAGDLGTSGRELAFRAGSGSAESGVTSSLGISDLLWHHVSVAYDASTGNVRFGLDGSFETVSFAKPAFVNSGPLRIGGHTNASGAANQFLRGFVDEMRISREFLAPHRLLRAPNLPESSDCNANALPDECEPDCNGNGVPDDCDIASRSSTDGDGDGVPDECQYVGTWGVPVPFATIQSALETVLDGSTIVVADGVYSESIDFRGKSVVLRSADGPEACVIDAGGTGSVVTFDEDETRDSVLEGFTIRGGDAVEGGGIRIRGASPTIRGNIIVGNEADFGGGVLVYLDAAPLVEGNEIRLNNARASSGGIYCSVSNTMPEFRGNAIVSNSSDGGFGAGVLLQNSAAILEGNEIAGNSGADSGGGVAAIFSGPVPARILNNTIRGNSATDDGGGLWIVNAGSPLVAGNLIRGNSAPVGGGAYLRDAVSLVNNTIVSNSASNAGAGIYCDGNAEGVVIRNSILRSNAAPSSAQIYLGGATVRHSNVEGGVAGEGNIDLAAGFVDAGAGVYALAPGSPCIDAGDSTAEGLVELERDLADNPRIADDPATVDTGIAGKRGLVIDMGALEFQPVSVRCPADLDGDGTTGASDIAILLSGWNASAFDLDGDGVVGASDLAFLLVEWGPCS
jgi:parallel beta-helix repeat protein